MVATIVDPKVIDAKLPESSASRIMECDSDVCPLIWMVRFYGVLTHSLVKRAFLIEFSHDIYFPDQITTDPTVSSPPREVKWGHSCREKCNIGNRLLYNYVLYHYRNRVPDQRTPSWESIDNSDANGLRRKIYRAFTFE